MGKFPSPLLPSPSGKIDEFTWAESCTSAQPWARILMAGVVSASHTNICRASHITSTECCLCNSVGEVCKRGNSLGISITKNVIKSASAQKNVKIFLLTYEVGEAKNLPHRQKEAWTSATSQHQVYNNFKTSKKTLGRRLDVLIIFFIGQKYDKFSTKAKSSFCASA